MAAHALEETGPENQSGTGLVIVATRDSQKTSIEEARRRTKEDFGIQYDATFWDLFPKTREGWSKLAIAVLFIALLAILIAWKK